MRLDTFLANVFYNYPILYLTVATINHKMLATITTLWRQWRQLMFFRLKAQSNLSPNQ